MSPKRKCFSCDDSAPVEKRLKRKEFKINCSLDIPYISLIRIEDDPKLQNYVTKNLKTDSICKETWCFTQNQSKSCSKKTEAHCNVNRSNEKRTLSENNFLLNASVIVSKTKCCSSINESPQKKGIVRKCFCSATSLDVIPSNVQVKDRKSVPTILISDTLKNEQVKNKRILKEVTEKNMQDKNGVSYHPNNGDVKKINLGPNEDSTVSVNLIKSGHMCMKLDENGQSVSSTVSSFDFVDCCSRLLSGRSDVCRIENAGEIFFHEDLKNANESYGVSSHKVKKCGDNLKEAQSLKAIGSSHLRENNKESTNDLSKAYDKTVLNDLDFDEPLTLITKLTGCQVAPSKVKILPLSTPCISNPSNKCFSDKIGTNKIETIKEKQVEVDESKISSEEKTSNGVTLSEDCEKSTTSNKGSVSESVSVLENKNRTRTIYDLMNDMCLVLPSWNLHILSDTNTFCIGQVTRNKMGIPHLSKCIELDDNFNAKVFIYQQHCKKFDGVYNSEETVLSLLNEVDKYH